MNIRQAVPDDLLAMCRVYEIARRYMVQNGNPNQWGSGYPPKELLLEDIERGRSYVGVDDSGQIHFVFFWMEDEPESCYERIEEGCWINDRPYGTIHRVASDGSERRVLAQCLTFCRGKRPDLDIRMDTHEDNGTMQHVLETNGFVRCGYVFLEDGSRRIGYHLVREK